MKKHLLRGSLVWGLVLLTYLAGTAQPVAAQSYRFRVDKNLSYVYINPDGSAHVEYWLTFTNLSPLQPVDIVDVGLPHGDYRLNTAEADIDGTTLSAIMIRKSEVLEHGIEVHLGNHALKKDQTGTLHVRITVDRMVWEDTTSRDDASLEFSPTWFDAQFTEGTTQLACTIVFPHGVTGDETRWHRTEYTQAQTLDDGRIAFTWANPEASPSRQYTFGVSFPRRVMLVVHHQPTWWEEILGNPITWIVGVPLLVFCGWWVYRFVRYQWGWRMDYLPPTVGVETAGPKRGLTAVEAAIVLNTPMDRILTMILFSLLKKGAVEQVIAQDPLRLKLADERPEGLYSYENDFLDAVRDSGRLREDQLQNVMAHLVKQVNDKLRGFNRQATASYYRDIVAQAWEQVRQAQTPEVRARELDENLEWTLLDRDFATTLPTVVGTDPLPLPDWWGHHAPVSEPGAGPAMELPSVSLPQLSLPEVRAPQASLPTLPGADFANALVVGVESTANHVVSGIEDFVRGVIQSTNPWAVPTPPPSVGDMAFGALDRVGDATGAMFDLLGEVADHLPEGGSGSGGGGSGRSSSSSSCACACACACAGCACACAGGGR